MHLDRATQIGGLPVLEVRRLLRRFGRAVRTSGGHGGPGVSQDGAHRALNRLDRAGFVKRDPDAGSELRWRRTPEGDAVAAATIRRSLTRARAERLLRPSFAAWPRSIGAPTFAAGPRVACWGLSHGNQPPQQLDLVVRLVPSPSARGHPSGRTLRVHPTGGSRKASGQNSGPTGSNCTWSCTSSPASLRSCSTGPTIRSPGQRVRIVYLESQEAQLPVQRTREVPNDTLTPVRQGGGDFRPGTRAGPRQGPYASEPSRGSLVPPAPGVPFLGSVGGNNLAGESLEDLAGVGEDSRGCCGSDGAQERQGRSRPSRDPSEHSFSEAFGNPDLDDGLPGDASRFASQSGESIIHVGR